MAKNMRPDLDPVSWTRVKDVDAHTGGHLRRPAVGGLLGGPGDPNGRAEVLHAVD